MLYIVIGCNQEGIQAVGKCQERHPCEGLAEELRDSDEWKWVRVISLSDIEEIKSPRDTIRDTIRDKLGFELSEAETLSVLSFVNDDKPWPVTICDLSMGRGKSATWRLYRKTDLDAILASDKSLSYLSHGTLTDLAEDLLSEKAKGLVKAVDDLIGVDGYGYPRIDRGQFVKSLVTEGQERQMRERVRAAPGKYLSVTGRLHEFRLNGVAVCAFPVFIGPDDEYWGRK